MFNNCADAVSDGLAKVGFDPGYTNSYTSVDDGIFSDGKSLKPMPNARFEEIKKNNADKIIPTFSEPQPIIPTNTGQNNTK